MRRCDSELDRLGVQFIAVSQGLDTDKASPTNQLLVGILAAVAEFERELIRERVLAGMRNAKNQGKAIGRPRRVFDRDEVRRLREAGLSFRMIGRRLGLGEGTVRRILRVSGDAAAVRQNPSPAIL